MKLKTSCTTRLFRSMWNSFLIIGYPLRLLHHFAIDFDTGLTNFPGNTYRLSQHPMAALKFETEISNSLGVVWPCGPNSHAPILLIRNIVACGRILQRIASDRSEYLAVNPYR